MSATYRAILFDLDGTLIDSSRLMISTFKFLGQQFGFEVKKDYLFSLMGQTFRQIISLLYPQGDISQIGKIAIEFQQQNQHLLKLYPHTKKTLQHLSIGGIKLGLVTSRGRNQFSAWPIWQQIAQYFQVILALKDTTNHKPHPEPLIKALKNLQIPSSKALYVGDSPYDLEAAQKISLDTAAAIYGFHGEKLIKLHPTYSIYSLKDLIGLIKIQ